jgi:hypothetical protein
LPLTCDISVELRGFETLTPSMRTRSVPSADVVHCRRILIGKHGSHG